MEQYPVNNPQSPLPPEYNSQPQYQNDPNNVQYYPQIPSTPIFPPEAVSQPVPRNDPNKVQYYPQSLTPVQDPSAPAGTPIFYQQDQPMQIHHYSPPEPQMESYDGYKLLAAATLVLWNFLFGLIALILAFVADRHAKSSNHELAQRYGRASIGMSISGMLVTFIIIVIVFTKLTKVT